MSPPDQQHLIFINMPLFLSSSSDQQCIISPPDQQCLIYIYRPFLLSYTPDYQHLISLPNQQHLIFVYTTLFLSSSSPDQQCLVFVSTLLLSYSPESNISFPLLTSNIWVNSLQTNSFSPLSICSSSCWATLDQQCLIFICTLLLSSYSMDHQHLISPHNQHHLIFILFIFSSFSFSFTFYICFVCCQA